MQHCSTLVSKGLGRRHPSEKGQILKLPKHCYKLSRGTLSPSTQCWEQAPSESPNSHRAGVEMTSFFGSVSTNSPHVTGTSDSHTAAERVTKCAAVLLEEQSLTDPQHTRDNSFPEFLLTSHGNMRAQESTFIAIFCSRNTEARFFKKCNAYMITGFAKE